MNQLMKRGRAQLQLALKPVMVLPHPIEHIHSQVIEALADLLLEAMGPEDGSVEGKEVSDEHENHA